VDCGGWYTKFRTEVDESVRPVSDTPMALVASVDLSRCVRVRKRRQLRVSTYLRLRIHAETLAHYCAYFHFDGFGLKAPPKSNVPF
jgi:hypothetical protein